MPPLAEQVAGAQKPRSFLLDASVMDMMEQHRITREDVRKNRIRYVFPEGLNQPDLRDECRALEHPEDFDLLWDLVMQSLVGKSLKIDLVLYDGTPVELCHFQVTSLEQNLRGVDAIDRYPCLINWLVDFMRDVLIKKYPMPGISSALPPRASGRKIRQQTPITPEEP
jgi:hypothetical protein